VNAIRTVDSARGSLPWTNIMKWVDYISLRSFCCFCATSCILRYTIWSIFIDWLKKIAVLLQQQLSRSTINADPLTVSIILCFNDFIYLIIAM
jgi:hypothetical protein